MPKTNDEILGEYKERFDEWFVRYMVPNLGNVNAVPPSESDVWLLLELHHIMCEYKRDPMKSLLLTKLEYDRDSVKGRWTMDELSEKMVDMLHWWAHWKPGALFV